MFAIILSVAVAFLLYTLKQFHREFRRTPLVMYVVRFRPLSPPQCAPPVGVQDNLEAQVAPKAIRRDVSLRSLRPR